MLNHRKSTDGGRVYFSRAQFVTVTALSGIASVVIFFLGILIGQSIEERKILQREEEVAKVPVESKAKKDDDLTFYETLTKPEPAPDAKPAPKAETPRSQPPWTVQIAAHRTRATAENMAAELRKRGHRAYVTSGELSGKKFYRVRVGRYGTRQEALSALRRLKAGNYKNAMVTRNQ